LIANV